MVFGGFDPGLQGAFVFIDESGKLLGKYKMPIVKNPKGKTEINVKEVVKIIEAHSPTFIMIESVHAMPFQGVTSMFSMGRGLGILEGVVSALRIPYNKCSPQSWQKEILRDFNRGDDSKAASIINAERMFPDADFRATERCKKIDDGLTDAANIALYAKKNFNQ
jgi:hypothetical protein